MKTTTHFPAPAWSGLGDIKRAHQELFDSASDHEVEPVAAQNFIRKAAATGRYIEDSCERNEAQRLINYWSANIPANSDVKRLSVREILLAPYDATGPVQLTNVVDEFLETCNLSEKAAARHIFLRLVCLDPDGTTFSRVARDRDYILSGLQYGVASEVLNKYQQLGLVVPQAGEINKLQLTGEPIFGRWRAGDDWLARRRRYRGAVRYWRSSGKDPTALLDRGDLLKEAILYLDLNDDEKAFAISSRERAGRQLWYYALGALAVALVVTGSALLYYKRKAENNAVQVRQALETIGELAYERRNRPSATFGEDASTEDRRREVTKLEEALSQVIVLNDRSVLSILSEEPLYIWANVPGNKGDWRETLRRLDFIRDRRRVEYDTKFTRLNYAEGVAAEACGDKGRALSAYRRALSINPSYGDAANNLAALLADVGFSEGRVQVLAEAKTLAERALQINPLDPAYHDTLGLTLFNWSKLTRNPALAQEALNAYFKAYGLLGEGPAKRDLETHIANVTVLAKGPLE